MDQIISIDKFRVPIGNQEIELQQVEFEAGGMPMLRVRIREHRRFTIFDIDPITAERWATGMLAWGEGRSDAGVMASDDEVVDLVFALRGRAIALDYADRLWEGLRERLPWLDQLELVGVHPLAGVSPGDSELYLTRRARLALRLPASCGEAARGLTGARLDLGGEVEVGALTQRSLTPAKVLYSSFVTMGERDEQAFMAACHEALAVAGIAGHLVCGKARRAAGVQGEWRGFSLMLHGLTGKDSLRLQRDGLGDERQRGCGIFVPHKAVAVVAD